MKKKTLGRGLSALLGEDTNLDSTQIEQQKIERYLEIDIDKILPNPNQARIYFDQEKLNELAKSIQSVGIIEPIVVTPNFDSTQNNKKYHLVAGERRFRAAQIAKLDKLPAIIQKDTSNDNLIELMLIENIQRENLSPIEEAMTYRTIIDRKKITQEVLSEIIGKSRSHIANLIRILKLSISVQDSINKGLISLGHAKLLLNYDEKEQSIIAKEIINKNLSVRELEKRTQNIHKKQKPKPTSKHKNNSIQEPHIDFIENKLRELLQTKIKISHQENKKKENKIEIFYYGNDGLESILDKIGISLQEIFENND